MVKKNESLNYISLFSGAGGLDLGFENVGFKNLFSVEFNESFCKTYTKNFPSNIILNIDISKLSSDKIKSFIQNKRVHLIIGGPPCQGFSLAGNIARKFVDDPRNKLFKEFVRIVNHVKPDVFLMENVASLKTHNSGKTLKKIIKCFASAGYDVKSKILNAVNYGVPQNRRRIFIVGFKKHNQFVFPKHSKKIITVKDAINDLSSCLPKNNNISNHVPMKHSIQMLEKMKFVKDGGNRNDIPKKLRPKSGDCRKYIRYDSKKPSVCVTGDMRKIFHYKLNRALTTRELARLQTFPDNFIFLGTQGQIQQQIGNAVPVKLAQSVAKCI
jgi:DNA (cytosine-5)-methyltransferase 1